MRRPVRLLAVAVLAPGVALPAAGAAAGKTLDGTQVCAKCFLEKADATECQDVLIVSDGRGSSTEYYVSKNAVAQESGQACTLEVKATVPGRFPKTTGASGSRRARSSRSERESRLVVRLLMTGSDPDA